MPSRRSPSDRSWYSARALSTFTNRFSIRTPVWIRSTVIMVHMYQMMKTMSSPCRDCGVRDDETGPVRSNLHLRPELDDLGGRNVEVVAGGTCVARHGGEEALAADRHASFASRNYGCAAEQKPCFQRRHREATLLPAQVQSQGYVRPVHESKINDHAMESVAELPGFDPLARAHPGNFADHDRQQHDVLMQHPVACEVPQQRVRNRVRVTRH